MSEDTQLDHPYHLIKSRTPRERRAERDVRMQARLLADMKGQDGIEVDGNVVRAGAQLLDPLGLRANNGASSGHVFIVSENGVAQYWRWAADLLGNV